MTPTLTILWPNLSKIAHLKIIAAFQLQCFANLNTYSLTNGGTIFGQEMGKVGQPAIFGLFLILFLGHVLS